MEKGCGKRCQLHISHLTVADYPHIWIKHSVALFLYLLAVLGLPCFLGFLQLRQEGAPLPAVPRPLSVVASPAAGHGPGGCGSWTPGRRPL